MPSGNPVLVIYVRSGAESIVEDRDIQLGLNPIYRLTLVSCMRCTVCHSNSGQVLRYSLGVGYLIKS